MNTIAEMVNGNYVKYITDLVSKAVKQQLNPENFRGAQKIMGVDVARFGDDRSVICKRQGLWCKDVKIIEKTDNMTFAGMVAREIDDFQPDAVFVDAGRGEGVIDRLRQLGYSVMEINFGAKAIEPNRYVNKRSEMWDKVRDWLESGGTIPNNSDLKTELSSPTYSFDARGRFVLEPKEKLKERGLRSPDIADALALTFAFPIQVQKRGWTKDWNPIAGKM